MKVKVSNTSGPALDWMVAKCEGMVPEGVVYTRPVPEYKFKPSTEWSIGGPIIEREEIGVERHLPCMKGEEWEARGSISAKGAGYRHAYGPTPLIAAMRCYVVSKMGEEAEVPDPLVV